MTVEKICVIHLFPLKLQAEEHHFSDTCGQLHQKRNKQLIRVSGVQKVVLVNNQSLNRYGRSHSCISVSIMVCQLVMLAEQKMELWLKHSFFTSRFSLLCAFISLQCLGNFGNGSLTSFLEVCRPIGLSEASQYFSSLKIIKKRLRDVLKLW